MTETWNSSLRKWQALFQILLDEPDNHIGETEVKSHFTLALWSLNSQLNSSYVWFKLRDYFSITFSLFPFSLLFFLPPFADFLLPFVFFLFLPSFFLLILSHSILLLLSYLLSPFHSCILHLWLFLTFCSDHELPYMIKTN